MPLESQLKCIYYEVFWKAPLESRLSMRHLKAAEGLRNDTAEENFNTKGTGDDSRDSGSPRSDKEYYGLDARLGLPVEDWVPVSL